MKNILIVDNDLGFLFWLGEALVGAEYQPWPACNITDALAMADRKPLMSLDLLIINPLMPGVSKVISHFRSRRPDLKVMALGSADENDLPGVNTWRQKPVPDHLSARQWVRAIDRISSGHSRAA